MAIRHAHVVIDEDPTTPATDNGDRSPWKEIPQGQFSMFFDLRRGSTGCAAAETALVQGVLGARLIVDGKGWRRDELDNASNEFMVMNRTVIEHLHMYGIVVITVHPVTRMPSVMPPEMIQIWHSVRVDGRSFYIIQRRNGGLGSQGAPLNGVAVFELRRPTLEGHLDSPLVAAMKNFNYVSMMQQAGVQACWANAHPRVFLQRESKDMNQEEKNLMLERGQYGVNERLALGAVAQAAILEENRITAAVGLHDVERAVRVGRGIFVDGTERDPTSGTLQFRVTNEPNIFDRLREGQTVAAGPMATPPPDLQAAVQQNENDIARIYQVPPALWGDRQTGSVAQTTLVHTYLQALAAWRSILAVVNEKIAFACQDDIDTFVLTNPISELERQYDESTQHARPAHEAAPSSRFMISGNGESFALAVSEETRIVRRKAPKRKRGSGTDEGKTVDVDGGERPAEPRRSGATAAEEGDREHKAQVQAPKTKAGRRKLLRVRFGSAMDVYAIEQMFEQGRISFTRSQILLSTLRGLDLADLEAEQLDPATQRPVHEIIEEAKALEQAKETGDGGALRPTRAAKKKKTTLEGRDDLVRTPPKVTGLGDSGQSMRVTLTRKAPGEAA